MFPIGWHPAEVGADDPALLHHLRNHWAVGPDPSTHPLPIRPISGMVPGMVLPAFADRWVEDSDGDVPPLEDNADNAAPSPGELAPPSSTSFVSIEELLVRLNTLDLQNPSCVALTVWQHDGMLLPKSLVAFMQRGCSPDWNETS